MSECIGLFWYIDTENCFVYEKFDLQTELHKSSPYITSPIAHTMLWEKYKRQYGGVKYNHFPRGRVNYNLPKEIFELDMDECIQKNTPAIAELCDIFHIHEPRIRIISPSQTNKNNETMRGKGITLATCAEALKFQSRRS
jgi:hypothetical protein